MRRILSQIQSMERDATLVAKQRTGQAKAVLNNSFFRTLTLIFTLN